MTHPRRVLHFYFWSLLAISTTLTEYCRADAILSHSLFSFAGDEPGPGYRNDSELGLVETTGNSRSSSVSAKQQSSYRWATQTVMLQGRYLEASAMGLETAKNWYSGLRYETKITSGLGAYAGQSVEADTFSGFTQRYASDLGIRRVIWQNEKTRGAAELGYQYQLENRFDSRDYRQLLRAYVEGAYRWNAKVWSTIAVEALPNIRNSDDWLLNGELAVHAELTKIFSIKTSYLLRYANLPAGPNILTTDSTLTTAFIASF